MKFEKFAIYLSFISMIVFCFCAFICYKKVNRKYKNLEVYQNVAIFTSETVEAKMDISAEDMLSKNNTEVAKTSAIINATYNSINNSDYKFDIVMYNDSDYIKSEGVDGENIHEYTYEIISDGIVLVPETESETFAKDSSIVLATFTLDEARPYSKYEIILRFYSNEYNQSHLLGTQILSKISTKASSI